MAKKPKYQPDQARATQCFIVEAIAREDIAKLLNQSLGRDEFLPDDVRLTDPICDTFAKGMFAAKDDKPGNQEASEDMLFERTLKENWGFDVPEPIFDEDDISDKSWRDDDGE